MSGGVQVGKAQDMREQELMRMQMQQAYRLGDSEKAKQLKGRLKPDEPVWSAAPPHPGPGCIVQMRSACSMAQP